MRGLQSDTHGLLYLRNQTDSELYRDILRQPPALLTDVQLRLSGLSPGHYLISVLDMRTGIAQHSSTAESQDGILDLDLPELRHDAAVRIGPRP